MVISLDTNVVVRLFIDEDPAQSAAAETCLERYNQIHLADTAIIETIFIIAERYEHGRTAAANCVRQLLTHPKIVCNQALFTKVLPMFERHPALSIEDCCLAVYAQLNDAAPLLTFDRKLANQLQHTELLRTS